MRKENMSLFFGLLVLTLIIGVVYYFATSPGPDEEAQTSGVISQAPVAPGQQTQTSGNTNPAYGDLTEDQIKMADIAIGQLLNSSQGITPPMITVKSFEAKEFPDASLGCPKEGMMSAQVITPGYQVILEAQGKEYDYRLTDKTNVILCEQ